MSAAAVLLVTGCTSTPATERTPTPSATPSPTATAATTPARTPTATPSAASSGTPAAAPTAVARYQDATYEVERRPVTLVNGVAEVAAAPGSASKVTTRVFGNEATGDLNGDGQADVAFVLTQSGGGSGTFYYIVAALKTAGGYVGTNAVLLGDRVAPQPTTIEGGIAIANYAERKPGEPMTAQPSVGVSKRVKVVDGRLVEVKP